jgi:hypothetical protein
MKKNILIYLGLVIIDMVGFLTMYFALITHGLLFIIISNDAYKFIVSYIEKNKGKCPYPLQIFLALFITAIGTLTWWFSYQFIFKTTIFSHFYLFDYFF